MTTAVPTAPSLDSIRETVISWRRHLHQHPELSFHEERTSQWIYDTLAEIGGLELSRPTKTSVVARLITGKDASDSVSPGAAHGHPGEIEVKR